MALSLGTFAASTLGMRLSLPRSTARYTCESLVRKGLMIETRKANTKLFAAENPTKLFSILHEQEAELIRKKEQLSVTVKELEQKYNPNAKLPKITFYEGIDGIGRMLDELLTHPTTLYSFGAGDYFLEKEPELILNFRKKAKHAYKKVFVMRSPKYRHLHEKDPLNYQTKYFQSLNELEVDFQITDDMLSITSIKQSIPVGILIKHKEIVNAFTQIFQELWNHTR